MRLECPINDLLKFIKDSKANPLNKVPQDLLVHAKSCEKCSEILSNPEQWDSFLNINEALNKTSNSKKLWIATPTARNDEHKEVKEGMVCRIKLENTSNSAFILITDISNIEKDGFIRISPISVSPHEEDVDEETDIIIPPSKMPTGLPSLIEWWNDRPVLANSINRMFGNLDSDNYKEIKNRIINQPKISKPTRSILLFREIEKNKGNQMSASFFEKFVSNEKIEDKNLRIATPTPRIDNVIIFNKATAEPICINIYDLFPANEELRMAAASKDVYFTLKEYLKKNYSDKYEVSRIDDGSNSFTIASMKGKEFALIITDKNNNIRELKSNPKGKLYLKEGLEDFEKIEFKE